MAVDVVYDFVLQKYRMKDTGGGSGGSIDGALMANLPFSTTVGPYTMTYTGSGGFMVSGGGAMLQVSSGAVTVRDEWGAAVAVSGGGVWVTGADSAVQINAVNDVEISAGGTVHIGSFEIAMSCNSMTVNSRPVALGLVTSTDSETTSATFEVLGGGTAYIYTQPLTALDIASVTSDCDATIKFTAGAGLSQIVLPSSGYYTGESAFTSGAHYFAAFNGADVVVIEQQKLDEA